MKKKKHPYRGAEWLKSGRRLWKIDFSFVIMFQRIVKARDASRNKRVIVIQKMKNLYEEYTHVPTGALSHP